MFSFFVDFQRKTLLFFLTITYLFSKILIGTFYIPFMSRGTAYETKKLLERECL